MYNSHTQVYLYQILLTPKTLNYFAFHFFFRIPDEDYSRNVSCALHLISMFLLEVGQGTSYQWTV